MELKLIKSEPYVRQPVKNGYTDRFLKIKLDDLSLRSEDYPERIKDIFIGGSGFNLWLLWEAVRGIEHPDGPTKWNDPENALCIASGPLCGTPGFPGAGKSIVTSISPLSGLAGDSNVGGYFGAFMKFSGFDAMAVSGIASRETVIFIDGVNSRLEFYECSGLPDDSYGLTAGLAEFFDPEHPENISVVSTGPGAKNSNFGCINISWYDAKRGRHRLKQAGRNGNGTVMAQKNIKAIVGRWDSLKISDNDPADREALLKTIQWYNREIDERDPKMNRMSVVGTTHIVKYMNDAKCLPVNNFSLGSHPDAAGLYEDVFEKRFDKGFDGCWKGCKLACAHGIKGFVPKTGPFHGKEFFVDGPEYETIGACTTQGIFSPDAIIEFNLYCDAYGLDTISTGVTIGFAMDCFERGLIDVAYVQGLDLRFGNERASLALLHQIAEGQGFGRLAGLGVERLKQAIIADRNLSEKQTALMNDIAMASKGMEFSMYITKRSLAQQGGYGLANKNQHHEGWHIFSDMIHNRMPSFRQKADYLRWFAEWRDWFQKVGLCKLPWNDIEPADNKQSAEPAKVMGHVEKYRDLWNAVTGKNMTVDEILHNSRQGYTFHRLFNLRMGYGRRQHDAIPYRAMGPATIEEYLHDEENYDNDLAKAVSSEWPCDKAESLKNASRFIKNFDKLDLSSAEAVDAAFTEFMVLSMKNTETRLKVGILRRYRISAYEELKNVVYKKRGYNPDGVPTLKTLKLLKLYNLPGVKEVWQAYQKTRRKEKNDDHG